MRVRLGESHDRTFIVEMARLACTLEGNPLPAAGDLEVVETLPGPADRVVIAEDDAGRALGAAWWFFHQPALLGTPAGRPLPELAVAVEERSRGRGVGTALIETLANEAAATFDGLSLNVHLLNPAARLYIRTGFRVAGAGRGWYGVAMVRQLHES